MNRQFINGRCAEKANMAQTLLAELRSFNTEEVEAAVGPWSEVLTRANVALQSIHDELRSRCEEEDDDT